MFLFTIFTTFLQKIIFLVVKRSNSRMDKWWIWCKKSDATKLPYTGYWYYSCSSFWTWLINMSNMWQSLFYSLDYFVYFLLIINCTFIFTAFFFSFILFQKLLQFNFFIITFKFILLIMLLLINYFISLFYTFNKKKK